MKKFILALSILLCSLLLLAQENYQPGFVISTMGDTVRGKIDYRNWKRNPNIISFKRETDGLIFFYDPSQIKGFSVAQEYYESGRVQTEVSPEKAGELSFEAEFILEEEVAFLQTLVIGSKSLYYLVNKKGKDNFYIKNGERLELLLHKQYARNVNYVRQVLINNRYIGQLSNYLNDCADLQSKVNNVRYSQKELTKLFDAYYQCKSERPEFKKSPERAVAQFGVMGGAMLNTLIIGKKNNLAISKAEYDHSFSLTGGIYLTLVLPRNQRRFAIQNELLFTSYNISGYNFEYNNDNDNIETTYIFKANHLKLNTFARVKIPTPNFDLHLEVGVSNALALTISAEQIQVVTFYAPPITKKSEAINTRSYEQGIVAGIGAHYKKFSLTGRFERGNGFSKAVSLKTAVNRFYFLVGYRISK